MDDKTLVERAAATPLLERLRRVPNDARLEYEHDPCHHSVFPIGAMCHEAATRIKALEADNADLKRRLDNICMSIHTCSGDECERPICIANRKNKALEAALRWIGEKCEEELPLEYNDAMRKVFQRNMRDAAKKALEGKAHD